MLLTITCTQPPATDLGYLLYKNPARWQTFDLPCGQAHVFYPEATPDRCTAALLLEMDPLALSPRQHQEATHGPLAAYVNDRPYVASSLLSVAIARVFGSALSGHCKERPELATTDLPLEVHLAVLPCRGGEDLLRRLFTPLGYALTVQAHPLDPAFTEWGLSDYYSVSLAARCRLSALLSHLYVLIPVLDENKHYWVGDEELDKLLRFGAGWLAAHPERELIAQRYLKHQRSLAQEAMRRLADEDSAPSEDGAEPRQEGDLEAPLRLDQQRLEAVLAVLQEEGASRVIDLGCGEGRLVQALLARREFQGITGMDVSPHALARAAARLNLERLAPTQRERVTLFQGSLTYRDKRLLGYDAGTLIEVIEHLDPERLGALERVLFAHAQPRVVVLTTPNREYNALFPRLSAGALRHPDHRFEWGRQELRAWAEAVARRHGYRIRLGNIGPEDAQRGAPTQIGVFTR